MAKNKLAGILDRFEGSKGVILLSDGENTIVVPRDLLPEGSKEGDMIMVTLDKKDKKTAYEKQKVRSLIDKLTRK